jgi:hypothetical protein
MFINSRSIRREHPATRQSMALRNMMSLPLCVLGLLLVLATQAESNPSALLRALQERIASNHQRLLGQQLQIRKLRSGRRLHRPTDDREPTLLRGYHRKQTDVALLASLERRRLNIRTLKLTKQLLPAVLPESHGFLSPRDSQASK